MRYYGKLPVNVERVWFAIVGTEQVQFTDLKVIGSGRIIEGIRADELSDKPIQRVEPTTKEKQIDNKLVVFTKKGQITKAILDSKEYKDFIKKNKLNETMVKNCLYGVVKTHKGYTIQYA